MRRYGDYYYRAQKGAATAVIMMGLWLLHSIGADFAESERLNAVMPVVSGVPGALVFVEGDIVRVPSARTDEGSYRPADDATILFYHPEYRQSRTGSLMSGFAQRSAYVNLTYFAPSRGYLIGSSDGTSTIAPPHGGQLILSATNPHELAARLRRRGYTTVVALVFMMAVFGRWCGRRWRSVPTLTGLKKIYYSGLIVAGLAVSLIMVVNGVSPEAGPLHLYYIYAALVLSVTLIVH